MTDEADAGDDTVDPDPDALSNDELCYPEFSFPEGHVSPDGRFDMTRERDHESTAAWLRDLADAIETHDVVVEGADNRATLGIGPEDVEMAFDPDDDHWGTLSVTFNFRTKLMAVTDADTPKIGARGGVGFIPREMLTDDRDPGEFRCYNWLEDPTLDGDERDADTGEDGGGPDPGDGGPDADADGE